MFDQFLIRVIRRQLVTYLILARVLSPSNRKLSCFKASAASDGIPRVQNPKLDLV